VIEKVDCTIYDADSVVASDVRATIERTVSREWYGYCFLPSGTPINPGQSYLLRTIDGRSGQIVITRTSPTSVAQAAVVEFRGSGPFG
jgi:hypothetical protein